MSLIYKKINGLKVKDNEDGTLTIIREGDFKYPINNVCKDIWKKINGIRSINDIALDMSYKYNVPVSDIKDDIQKLFKNFKENGLIEEIW